MTIDEMKTLSPELKRTLRAATRKQLSIAAREYMRPQAEDKRAWLSGYLDFARKALEALT